MAVCLVVLFTVSQVLVNESKNFKGILLDTLKDAKGRKSTWCFQQGPHMSSSQALPTYQLLRPVTQSVKDKYIYCRSCPPYRYDGNQIQTFRATQYIKYTQQSQQNIINNTTTKSTDTYLFLHYVRSCCHFGLLGVTHFQQYDCKRKKDETESSKKTFTR